MEYDFDRYLRFAELTQWLQEQAQKHPNLVEMSSIGKSYEGREQWLFTITNKETGEGATKPAHWVDANIHATEVTAGVAACYIIHHLLSNFAKGTPSITEALNTRTFYILPRVNPDGVELALADTPTYLRSSVKAWPWGAFRWPGHAASDITGNGRILTMRIEDKAGAWTPHPDDPRVMMPVDHANSPVNNDKYDQSKVKRYRLLPEGLVENYDGFTIPTPRNVQGLDLNRNFPAGWGKDVPGSGEHALSEVEINNLVRAIGQRPNICGYNAFHTAGGVLLRPSSTEGDDELPYQDVWAMKEMGQRGETMTNCKCHSMYEDYTMDKKDACASGASDDFAYYHLGIYGWTTEFWDVVLEATGQKGNTKRWYVGHSTEDYLAIAKWADKHCPQHYHEWKTFQHPQLGTVEIGGPDEFNLIDNPPLHMVKDQVAGHADFAVYQAMLSPKLEILMTKAEHVAPAPNEPEGTSIWRVKVGVANTGFFPTNVTSMALKIQACLDVTVEIENGNSVGCPVRMADGYSSTRQKCGQLQGRMSTRMKSDFNDGTPERALCQWLVYGKVGDTFKAVASHPRAGEAVASVILQM